MQAPEEILKDLFDLLPDAVFKNTKTARIGFGWGSQDDLNKYIKVLGNKQKYPLIWLVNTKWTENRLAQTIKGNNVRLIIAVNSNKLEALNPTIWDDDFKIVLDPIKENILLALATSGRTILQNDNIDIQRVPNYSHNENNKTKTIDIWNALVIDCTIELNHNSKCFTTIKFN